MTFAKPIVPSELELSTFSLLELEEDCGCSEELDTDSGTGSGMTLEEDFGASLDELWAILLEDGYSITSPLLPL
jgi:hypothetical protein